MWKYQRERKQSENYIRKPPADAGGIFWEEGLSSGEPDNPCMKKSIVGGSEVVSF